MPTFNRVRDAYSTKKKNALSPYLTSGMSQSQGTSQLRQAQTMPFDASGTAAASQPSGGQSAVSRAYSRATTPASTASPQQYEPGSILRESAASANTSNTANAGSAITSTPNTPLYSAYNAQATPSVSTPAGAQNSAVYRAYSAQSTPQTTETETPAPSAVYSAYGTQNGQQNGAYSAQRQNAINQATANYNKLLNYLPEYLDIMGMRGLGVSEQALLNAASDYQQGIADINASYDELERAYRDQQIANASTVYANLSEYIANAGDNFTQEGYDRFKQGLLQAGYTEQEIAAGENMLGNNDYDQVTQVNDPVYNGEKSLSITIYDAAGRKNNSNIYLTDALHTIDTGEIQQRADDAAKKLGLNVKDGTAIREGNLLVVYYKGQWYMFDSTTLDLKEQK